MVKRFYILEIEVIEIMLFYKIVGKISIWFGVILCFPFAIWMHTAPINEVWDDLPDTVKIGSSVMLVVSVVTTVAWWVFLIFQAMVLAGWIPQ